MVSHIHGIEYGEWEFKHTVAVRRLSFTGWIDVFARRMPEDEEVRPCRVIWSKIAPSPAP
jgi:hypothetical protein